MPHPAIASALLLLTANGAPTLVQDVAIFEAAPITENISVTAFGIIKDSRCGDSFFCNRDEQLIVAAIISDGGAQREVAIEMGKPMAVSGGTLILAGTATAASNNGAIQLKKYSLDFTFQPNR
ncbi:MAG: hypothetical protein ABJ239_12515 [Erythrobacter sp.]